MSAEYMVATYNLSKSYNSVYRVDTLNLNVRQGEIYGFLGPNGAGKSTSLKMLLGLTQPSGGRITLFGKELSQHRISILSQVGSLIESPSYYGHLTGLENMRVMKRLRGVPERNIREALGIVRLEKHQHKRVDQYSLGMKQRLGIAMALLAFPRLLILDEPTNGLDPAGIGEIRELIKSLPGRYGITVLISSHLLSEIEQMATSVGIIHEGKLLFQGDLTELQARGQSSVSFTTQDAASAESLLLASGFQPVNRQGRLHIEGMQDEQIAEANRLLVSAGIPVIRIEEHKKSLEEIFLDLTGRERTL
ncbi:ATP-binding cassette domain-containing protein [Paenibacillus filicis]|uniref:ATP-binding cassette domain-containing protein n=1 Tax=Paenibacillus filicis TaxID=669464 RepID=A0ABU9DUF3_9BACL